MKDRHNILFDSAISKINLEITNGAYSMNEENWSISEPKSMYSRIFFMDSGSATIEYSSKKVTLSPGNVYIIPIDFTFKGYSDVPHNKLYFTFSLKLPDGSDAFSAVEDILTLNIGEKKMSKIIKLFFSSDIIDIITLKSIIMEYALKMMPKNTAKKLVSVVYSPTIQQVIDYIRDNLSIQLTAESLSEHFKIPVTTLAKRFKKEVGVTIGKYIDDKVFERARYMLVNSQYPIKQISDMLGFCDRFYFSRRFKSKFVTTPHNFRKIKTTTFTR